MNSRLALPVTLAVLFNTAASAEEKAPNREGAAEFSLYAQRYDTDLALNGTTIKTHFDRLGLNVYQEYYPWFQPGIHLGYELATQDGNPSTTGFDLSGGYLGISLRNEYFPSRIFGLQFQFDDTYHYVAKKTVTQETNLKWNELLGKAGVKFRFSHLQIPIGAYYQAYSGDETALGNVTQTRGFKSAASTGWYAAFDFRVDRTGKISFHTEQGNRQGTMLIFSREYN